MSTAQESPVYTNRYPGKCNNCKVHVPASEGFTQKLNGVYVVWCKECVPVRKTNTVKPPQIRKLTAEGQIIMPYEPENITLVKSLPGARWNPELRRWSVSLEMSDRRRVLEVADRIGLDVDSSLRTIELSEEAKNAHDTRLFPYQIDGVDFLAQKDRALLGDEMGLGKSLQSLMGIPRNNGMAMVICRAGLKYNWFDEVKKWRSDLTPTVLSGRKSFRWPNPGEVIIINNDILPEEFNTPKKKSSESMEQYWARLGVYRNDLKATHPQAKDVCMIVDEAHDYKNRDAARTRKVKELGKLCGKLIGLTGSPLTNRPEDLYGVLDVLGMAKEVFGSWQRYQQLFNVTYDTIRAHGRYINVPIWGKPQPIVPELLRRVMLRRLRKDVLKDLPSKIYTNLTVNNVDADLQSNLDELWDEWGTMIEAGELPPFEEFSAIRAKLAASRIPEVLDYVENAEEQEVPLVVFSAHLAPIHALAERPGWKIITGDTASEKRQEIVREFQAGKLKGVALTIRAGGVGINLTHAWKALFIDLDWTPAANWQAEDRICRIGQEAQKVEIVRMVSNHPLDIHVQRLLTDKIDTIVRSIDASIKGEKKEIVKSEVVEEETVEQYEGRMKTLAERAAEMERQRAEQEAANQKSIAKSKVEGIHNREKTRFKKEMLPLTPNRVEAVRKAFRYMLSVCDGAKELDGCGFNKPDAVVAHWLLSAGLETDQEVEAGFYILSRYHRQLQGDYPILFKKEKGE